MKLPDYKIIDPTSLEAKLYKNDLEVHDFCNNTIFLDSTSQGRIAGKIRIVARIVHIQVGLILFSL